MKLVEIFGSDSGDETEDVPGKDETLIKTAQVPESLCRRPDD
jgi:hypothetical protein